MTKTATQARTDEKAAAAAPAKTGADNDSDVSFFTPLLSLRHQVDEMVEDAFGRFQKMMFPHIEWPTFTGKGEEKAGIARFDFSENDKAVTVTAEVPGMAEDDIEVVVENGILTIKGEKKSEREEKDDNYYLSERRFGAFSRSFRLPDGVLEDKIDADFKKGVLTVSMPKGASAQKAPRRIAVKAS